MKRISIIKRLFFIALIFLLSINTFGAIVSESDGPTFVTKEVFDDLRNNFANQIDNYGNSISRKIDGAIAQYLKNRGKKKTMVPVIHSDWEDIYFMNQEVKPEFHLPEFIWMVGGGLGKVQATQADQKYAAYTGFKKYNITWGANDTNYRTTVGLISGNEETPGKLYWDGVAIRWREQMYIGKYLSAYTGNMYGVDYYRALILHPFSFSTEGYIKGVNQDTLILAKPKLQASSDNATWNDANADNADPHGQVPYDERAWFKSFVDEDELDGETKCYKHVIINNGTSTSYWVSNRDWTNRIYLHADNPNKDSTLGSDASVETHLSGSGNIFLINNGTSCDYKGVTYNNMNFTYDNVIIPCIGMLESKVKANQIYQQDYEVTSTGAFVENEIKWNGLKIENAKELTLDNGIEICVSADEEEYTYDVNFESIECYNGAAKEINKNEIDVYLSYIPFGDGLTTSDPVILKGGATYKTTVGRKVTLQWTGTKKSLVYMKCKPHWTGTSYMDKDFTIKLDHKNSNNVLIYTDE